MMKMKISKYSVLSFILIAELLFDTDFLYLLSVRHFLAFLFTGFALLVYYCNYQKSFRMIKRNSGGLITICFLYLISYVIILLYSIITYKNQSLYETFVGENESYSLLFFFLVFPILTKIYHDKGPSYVLEICNSFALALCLLEILQVFIYQRTGLIFMTQYFENRTIGFRTYGLRIIMHWSGNIMSIYNFYMFYSYRSGAKIKSSLKYLALFLIMILDQILISQTRQTLLIIGLCLIYLVIVDRNNKFGLLKKGLVSGSIILFVFVSGIISKMINSFSLTGELGVSTAGRLYSYKYYWEYFLAHPIFGFGFANRKVNPTIVAGLGSAVVDDVGIVGQLAKLGLFVIPMYIVPLVRCIYILVKANRSRKVPNFTLYFAFLLFVVLGSATQIVLDQERILLFPIVLAISEYISRSSIDIVISTRDYYHRFD